MVISDIEVQPENAFDPMISSWLLPSKVTSFSELRLSNAESEINLVLECIRQEVISFDFA